MLRLAAQPGRVTSSSSTHLSDLLLAFEAHADAMNVDVFGILALLVALVALNVAAWKWGVDSRFVDVRSDFFKS